MKSPARTPIKRVTRSKKPIATTNDQLSDQIPEPKKAKHSATKTGNLAKSPRPIDGCFRRVLMKEAPQIVENLPIASQGQMSVTPDEFEDSNNNATVTNPIVGSTKSLINAIKGRKHKIADNNKQGNLVHKDPFYADRPQPQCSNEQVVARNPQKETQPSTEKFLVKNKGRNADPDPMVGDGVSIGINSLDDEYPEVMDENRDELYETHSSDSDSDNSLSRPSDSSDGEIPDEEPPEVPPNEISASHEPPQITEREDEADLTEKEVLELRQDPKVKKLLKAFWLETVGSNSEHPSDGN